MVEDRFWEQERRCVLTCFSALAPTNQRNRAEMEDREMKATQRLEDDVPKQEPIKLGSGRQMVRVKIRVGYRELIGTTP